MLISKAIFLPSNSNAKNTKIFGVDNAYENAKLYRFLFLRYHYFYNVTRIIMSPFRDSIRMAIFQKIWDESIDLTEDAIRISNILNEYTNRFPNFEQYEKLNLEIVVPVQLPPGAKRGDCEEVVLEASKEFNELGGGSRIQSAIGSWIDGNEKLVVENCVVIFTAMPIKNWHSCISVIRRLIKKIQLKLKQECVFLRIDNQTYGPPINLLGGGIKDFPGIEEFGDIDPSCLVWKGIEYKEEPIQKSSYKSIITDSPNSVIFNGDNNVYTSGITKEEAAELFDRKMEENLQRQKEPFESAGVETENKLEQEKFTVRLLLGGQRTLSTAPYQRDFIWNSELVVSLFHDTIVSTNAAWGGFVLVKKEEGHYEVIDGVQRIYAILIILSSVRDYLDENGYADIACSVHSLVLSNHFDGPRFVPHERHRRYFEHSIHKYPNSDFANTENTSEENISKCYDVIMEELSLLDPGVVKNKVEEFLSTSVIATVIANTNQDLERIYQTINSQSIPLNEDDLNTFKTLQKRRAQTAKNASELLVLQMEKSRLIECGREDLAEQVNFRPLTQFVDMEFDIASFENDGTPRFITVKTSRGKYRGRWLSRSEESTAEKLGKSYVLYLVKNVFDGPSVQVLVNPHAFFQKHSTNADYLEE